jgi:hypothetical protein
MPPAGQFGSRTAWPNGRERADTEPEIPAGDGRGADGGERLLEGDVRIDARPSIIQPGRGPGLLS